MLIIEPKMGMIGTGTERIGNIVGLSYLTLVWWLKAGLIVWREAQSIYSIYNDI